MTPIHIMIGFRPDPDGGISPGITRDNYNALLEVIRRNVPSGCEMSLDDMAQAVLAAAVMSLADSVMSVHSFDCGQRVYFTFADPPDDEPWAAKIARQEQESRLERFIEAAPFN